MFSFQFLVIIIVLVFVICCVIYVLDETDEKFGFGDMFDFWGYDIDEDDDT